MKIGTHPTQILIGLKPTVDMGMHVCLSGLDQKA
jgi:hypothetical protein